ncbi:hypothetical protein MXD61_09300 [Frankia sp. AgPm24]|uniref:Integral membrane protein n=1 Tax=Frankia umida TaxID=573489 RepID=A0ABT0K0L1_9ACTN|nr:MULTISPECIES: hypothetical protein [Frankia]MCK9877318.1 hypothetical protein [Frankia umida]MCK9922075.1 hypothetical protein [Frankia sp. AgPm24]
MRALTVAVAAVLLGLGAHTAACGQLPSLPVTAIGMALTARVCWGAAGRRLSLARLVALVVGVQSALHLAFTLTASAGMAGHASSDSVAAVAGAGVGTGGGAAVGVDLLPGGPIVAVAHLGAALLLAWWLATGERLLWRAARGAVTVARATLRRLRRRALTWVHPPPARTPPVRRPPPRTAGAARVGHDLVRRGPPARASV